MNLRKEIQVALNNCQPNTNRVDKIEAIAKKFAEHYHTLQLQQCGVSNCNAKKDANIENTILFINRKDGLTDVYDENGCLGKGIDTQGLKDLSVI